MLPLDSLAESGPGRTYGGLSAAEREERARSGLMDAGRELFADRGFAAVGVRDLCRSAKVSERSFYATVGSREALLRAVYLDATDAVIADISRALDGAPDDLPARLRIGLGAFFQSITDEPRHGRLIYVESLGRGEEIEAARREGLGRFTALVLGQLAPFRPASLPDGPEVEAAVAAALTGVGELAYRVAEGELLMNEAAIDRLVSAVAGLAVGAGLIALDRL